MVLLYNAAVAILLVASAVLSNVSAVALWPARGLHAALAAWCAWTLTQYENREYIRRAVRIGARGYLLKRSVAAQLQEAIRAVHAGQRYLHPSVADELVDLGSTGRSIDDADDDYDRLTPREKQVFKLLAEGKTSREISKYLTISLKTAMTHRTNIMEKLNMHTRSELIRYAVRKAIIPMEEV